MDNALIVTIAALVGLAFGYMVGRFSGFVDAAKTFNSVIDEVAGIRKPKRDSRGRFTKKG